MRLKSYMKAFGLVVLFSVTAMVSYAGTYSGGDGSSGNPYQINNVTDLLEMDTATLDWVQNFALTADIDMVGQTFHPIGYEGTVFKGRIDGQGHVIKNLTVTNRPGLATTNEQGFVGYGQNCQIENLGILDILCEDGYSAGSNIGAIAGRLLYADGLIRNCFVIGGSLRGRKTIGSIVGELRYGKVSNCFGSLDLIDGYYDSRLGGIVGAVDANASVDSVAVYNMTFQKRGANTNVGDAIVGDLIAGTVSKAYYNSSINAIPDNGGTALTAVELKQSASYDFDFTTPIWVMKPNSFAVLASFPITAFDNLPTQLFSGGNGSAGDPYLISYSSDLVDLYSNSSMWGSNFILTANIDMDGVVFHPIGTNATKFTGVFDGGNFVIQNLTITSYSGSAEDYQGFIGYGRNCTVKNLGLMKVLSEDAYDGANSKPRVGGIAGKIEYGAGLIQNCFVLGGTLKGRKHVGAIIGELRHGRMENCFAAIDTISGLYDNEIGGMVGFLSAGATVDSVTMYHAGFYKNGNNSNNGDAIIGALESGTGAAGVECYFSDDINALADNGGTAKTPTELRAAASYGNLDFGAQWQMLGTNQGFAVLKSFSTSVFQYTVTPGYKDGTSVNGTVAPLSAQSVFLGESSTFTFSGNPVADIWLNNVQQNVWMEGIPTSYTFYRTSDMSDVSMDVLFSYPTASKEVEKGISIYCANGVLSITSAKEQNSFKLYNLSGKLIAQRSFSGYRFEQQLNVTPGVYIVEVNTGAHVQKVIFN